MADPDEKLYASKVPTFDGTEDEYPFWKVKMRSFIAQKNCVELLQAGADDIEADSKVWTATEIAADTAGVEAKKKLRKQNLVASGYLMNCIDTKTQKGKSVFKIVNKFVTDDHAGGHFLKAWKALEKKFEQVDVGTRSELKQQYGQRKMAIDESPSSFILDMEE